jgi:hypothetical protein
VKIDVEQKPNHFAMDNVDDEGFVVQEGERILVGGMNNMSTPHNLHCEQNHKAIEHLSSLGYRSRVLNDRKYRAALGG